MNVFDFFCQNIVAPFFCGGMFDDQGWTVVVKHVLLQSHAQSDWRQKDSLVLYAPLGISDSREGSFDTVLGRCFVSCFASMDWVRCHHGSNVALSA